MTVFNVEQCKLFLEGVKNDRLYYFYALAIGCGLRLGELIPLEYNDFDYVNSTVRIQRTLSRVSGKTIIGEPKSERSRRVVSVPAFALPPKGKGYLFTTGNGTLFSHRNIERHFKNTLVKLGLPIIRFHDLRHTFASIMLSENVHPKAVQEALGHSSISLTLDVYSHVIPGMQKEAAEKMDKVLRI
jgi:integrase